MSSSLCPFPLLIHQISIEINTWTCIAKTITRVMQSEKRVPVSHSNFRKFSEGYCTSRNKFVAKQKFLLARMTQNKSQYDLVWVICSLLRVERLRNNFSFIHFPYRRIDGCSARCRKQDLRGHKLGEINESYVLVLNFLKEKTACFSFFCLFLFCIFLFSRCTHLNLVSLAFNVR